MQESWSRVSRRGGSSDEKGSAAPEEARPRRPPPRCRRPVPFPPCGLPASLPPPRPAQRVAAERGIGVGACGREAPRRGPHTEGPSLRWERVPPGFRELPDPGVRSTWETLLLSAASEPASETKLYCAVTSSARMGKGRRFLPAPASTPGSEFQTVLRPSKFKTRLFPGLTTKGPGGLNLARAVAPPPTWGFGAAGDARVAGGLATDTRFEKLF